MNGAMPMPYGHQYLSLRASALAYRTGHAHGTTGEHAEGHGSPWRETTTEASRQQVYMPWQMVALTK